MPHTTGFAAPSTRWLWSCQCPENEKKHDLRNKRSAFWFRTAPQVDKVETQMDDISLKWSNCISHRIHGAGIYANIWGILLLIVPYMAAPWILWVWGRFSVSRHLQVDIRNICKTSPLQPLLSSLARQQCSRPSSRYHVPDPNFTRWKDGDIWRLNYMTNIKHDQTWSNLTCWDMFFCQRCFTLSVFHSYFIHITYISSNFSSNRKPAVSCFPKLQRFAVSPVSFRRLHSKSCTKWPAFEANWICDDHLSPLDLRWW